jgi:hypothetical protein
MGENLAKAAVLALIAFIGLVVAGILYVTYKDDVARPIEVIQGDKLRRSISDSPLLGNKNPIDQVLQGKLKSANFVR